MIVQRIVCIYLPTWPIDRLKRNVLRQQRLRGESRNRRSVTPAMLLVTSERSRRIVASCCAQSLAQGVHPGMALTQARALINKQPILEAEHEPQRDHVALRALASWCVRFSPLVAPDPPNGILIDVSGCDRLFGGERRMLNTIGNNLERLGVANRACCAGTIGCAWAMAHYGDNDRCSIPSGNEQNAIESLPIEALRIDAEIVTALHEVNVDTIGQLLDIPRLELATRFDEQLLLRLDQALGETAEVIEPIRLREPIVAERVFDGAVTSLESLFHIGRELTERICTLLTQQESGATRLELSLKRIDAASIRMAIRFSSPTRDPKHLWSLLRPRLESVNMGFGVEQITLSVTAARRMAHQQQSQWNDDARHDVNFDRSCGELIDTLVDRLGPQRALVMRVVESHVPERVMKLDSAIDAGRLKRADVAVVESDRPSRLLNPPEKIDVIAVTPEGPPLWMRWRQAEHRLVAAHGPERISDEWWNNKLSGAARDYFKVQNEHGRWLWIFRNLDNHQWFVHGEWA